LALALHKHRLRIHRFEKVIEVHSGAKPPFQIFLHEPKAFNNNSLRRAQP